MAVSQKQIAEQLGVSIALVSRVLSGRAEEIGIASSTIKRVEQAAEKLGYTPSAAALTLKGKATHTIGVLVYDFKDPFFGSIIEQLQLLAHDHGYSLVLSGFKGRHPEENGLQPLRKHAIDGLIVVGSDLHADWLPTFSDLPIARIGHGSATEASVRITVDEALAARQIITRIGFHNSLSPLFIGLQLPAHTLRLESLKAHAESKELSLQHHMVNHKDAFRAGHEAVRKLIASGSEIDGLICATDQIAMGALHALRETPSRLEKIPITGFDDIPAAAQFIPPITSIRQPIDEISQQAFLAVLHKEPPTVRYLPGQLIIRQTA